jgi:hypothetical protein
VFRGESGRITAVKKGADRSAPEVVGGLYLKLCRKAGQKDEITENRYGAEKNTGHSVREKRKQTRKKPHVTRRR